jgi:hypothetical protein
MSFLNRLLGKEDYEEKLLETLVDKGLISLDRAQELLVSVRNTGGRAAELVVKSGAVPEGVLMAFLARSLKTAPLDVTKFPMRQNITSLITADVAVAGRLLPMEKIGSSLTLAMSNPLDRNAIEHVEKLTGLKVKVVVTGASMLTKRLKEAYPEAVEMFKKETLTGVEPPVMPGKEKRAPVRVVGQEEAKPLMGKKVVFSMPLDTPGVKPDVLPKPYPPVKPAKKEEEVFVVVPEPEEKPAAIPEPETTKAPSVPVAAEPVDGAEFTLTLQDYLEEAIGAKQEPYAEEMTEMAAAETLGVSKKKGKK